MDGQPQSVPQSKLIERAQRGDEQALEALVNTYKQRVYCFCLRMTRNPDQAEDLSQDAFLQLFRGISTFRGESAFSTWFHGGQYRSDASAQETRFANSLG
jgi:RNA polymerase sigma-70 factor (ECF subfamily)